MNQARDIKTGQVIDAESLKYIYHDSLSEYQCIDASCGARLIPCSYKPINKNRPYFKSANGVSHSKSCQFNKYLKLLAKGKNRALTKIELVDMPFPTKLETLKIVEYKSTLYKTENTVEEPKAEYKTRKKASGEFVKVANKSKKVSSVSPIVDFYLKCPFNRDEVLEIGNKKQEYMYWFKRISKPILSGNYRGRKIYFGQLHTDKNKIEETDTTLKIIMYECERWDKKYDRRKQKKINTQVNPFIISIDKSQLSKNKISRIKNEIEYVIEEKIQAFKDRKESEEDLKKQAYVFFYGDAPNSKEPYTFKVSDGILVARYARVLPTENVQE